MPLSVLFVASALIRVKGPFTIMQPGVYNS
jgi:hypothetical protein